MAGRLAPLFGGAQLARPAKGPFVFRACVLREHRGPARTMQELTEAARWPGCSRLPRLPRRHARLPGRNLADAWSCPEQHGARLDSPRGPRRLTPASMRLPMLRCVRTVSRSLLPEPVVQSTASRQAPSLHPGPLRAPSQRGASPHGKALPSSRLTLRPQRLLLHIPLVFASPAEIS